MLRLVLLVLYLFATSSTEPLGSLGFNAPPPTADAGGGNDPDGAPTTDAGAGNDPNG